MSTIGCLSAQPQILLCDCKYHRAAYDKSDTQHGTVTLTLGVVLACY
jgi:hypothetical protein